MTINSGSRAGRSTGTKLRVNIIGQVFYLRGDLQGSGNFTWLPPVTGTVTVECWGAGQAGANAATPGGGKGGGYAKKLGIQVIKNVGVLYTLGQPGTSSGQAGGDTKWNTNKVVAQGGNSATTQIGDVVFTGGTGNTAPSGNSGGGGAAGPHGNGHNAGSAASTGGSGGGGNGGGTNGANSSSAAGGAGGNGFNGIGGSGNTKAAVGGNRGGTGGGGAGGQSIGSTSVQGIGGNGGNDFDNGGGGGGGAAASSSQLGGSGGHPGGGSGSKSGSSGTPAPGGCGAIKITYTK